MAKAQGPQKLGYLEKLEYGINLFTTATKHFSNIARNRNIEGDNV